MWEASPDADYQGQETFPTVMGGIMRGKRLSYSIGFVSLLILPAMVKCELFKAGICDGLDDAYQAGISFVPDISYIRTGCHDTYGYYYSGFRFQDVTIENGVTIDSAFLKMYGGPDTVTTVTSTIYGHNVADSDSFAYSNDSLHERDSTSAKVFWTYGIKEGVWNKTPDIGSIISEIINLPGWSSGNALSIILHTTDTPDEDKRGYWRSYEWSPDSVCTLSVYWTEASVIEEFTKELTPTRTTIKCLPNPCNSKLDIKIDVNKTDKFSIEIYDITGRCIKTLFQEKLLEPGHYRWKYEWNNPSGIYYIKLTSPTNTITRKFVIVR